MSKERSRTAQVFVAKFNKRTRKEDLDKAFGKYGAIVNIEMKNGFAFIVRHF